VRRRAAVALALAGAVLGGCYVAETTEVDPGKLADFPLQRVRDVLSGDTILLDDGASGRRVRYAGVHAPSPGSMLAGTAKAENARLVEGQEVRVIPVHVEGDTEWGWVFVPNSTRRMLLVVQWELARQGLLRPADVPRPLEDEYFDELLMRAEAARRERRGLWADETAAR
jgi:endonuclease YncB( thermonuclease family)